MQNELPLSEREMEILRLAATGASNKEIALTLGISPNTVKVHLRNIFEKIGAASRTEAAAYAIRMGWVEMGDIPADPEEAERAAPEPVSVPQKISQTPGMRLLLIGLGILLTVMFIRRTMTPPAEINSAALTPLPPETGSEQWEALSEMPAERSGMAGVVFENRFYLLGGEGKQGLTAPTWEYTPETQTWASLADKPTPVRYAPAAVLGGQIYLAGGELADGKPVNHLESYNPREDRWESHAPLPENRSQAALAAFEGKLYLFGGWNGMAFSADVYRYDPTADQWELFASLPSARGFASAVVSGNKVLLIGGRNNTTPLDETLAFHPQWVLEGEDPWEQLAPLPQGRFAMGTVELAGNVYLVGGQSYGQVQSILTPLVLHTAENKWAALEAPPLEVGPYLGLLAYENRLHVLGGQTLMQGMTASHQTFQAIYTRLIPLIP
ncbi:hypothetical protein ADN00_16235 [Ornatilinea apprima]|uniref:HTH luxR-type domain-containing protein n=1 Tax=Ornatilinea apprima TaxID=1134406 RepID=A0A0P6XA50_9CHLR|nr:helix-turn-helix domain-containing protein [Ornatilinea apprima]KPL72033.1 hypothetical protein ADN00_16235 [Ornatilinea apprima]